MRGRYEEMHRDLYEFYVGDLHSLDDVAPVPQRGSLVFYVGRGQSLPRVIRD